MMITIPAIDPVAFSIFNWPVHWYGIAYVVGIILASIWGKILLKKYSGSFGLSPKQLDDFIPYFVIGILLGGRFGHLIFFEFDSCQLYLQNPIEIISVWKGGMAFHGGLIGAMIGCLLFCKNYKINFYKFIDLLALIAPIGLFFGRVANFINYEVYGLISFGKFAVKYGNHVPRIPTQLYEAFLEGIVLFVVLNITYACSSKIRTLNGAIAALFLLLYGWFRALIEPLKVQDTYLNFYGNQKIGMGLLLSLTMIIFGLLWLCIIYYHANYKVYSKSNSLDK